jgi:GTP-binding protein Era
MTDHSTGNPTEKTLPHRSGFACLVGRPNAGKSTLANALVGQKIAITSSRPQTTRHTVRGIVHRPDAQLVLVDTPGLHRPRTLLGQRLNDRVHETLAEVDIVGLCIPADEKIGPGDKFIAEALGKIPRSTKIGLVTKTDKASKQQVAEQLLALTALGEQVLGGFADVVPGSAKTGEQVDTVAEVLLGHLPEGPRLYPDGELTDEPESVMVAELVREAALEGVRDELPHSLAVVVEEMNEGDNGVLQIFVWLYVERDSQKGIIIGKGGARLKDVGTRARRSIEALLGTRVHLDLRVKIAKDWQRDPKQLQRLGF